MASIRSRKIAVVSILSFQVVLIALFSIFVKYDTGSGFSQTSTHRNESLTDSQYPSK